MLSKNDATVDIYGIDLNIRKKNRCGPVATVDRPPLPTIAVFISYATY